MYQFDRETDRFIKSHDYSWNHYCLEDFNIYNADIAVKEILDPKKTLEEQLEAQKVFNERHVANFPAPPQEMLDLVDIKEVRFPGIDEDGPEVRALVITPKAIKGTSGNPCLIYFYCGGMIMGAPEAELIYSVNYAIKMNCVVVSPDYRLLPEWPYPAAANDAEATVNYILANKKELGVSTRKVVAYGHSSGAYMAAVLGQRLKLRGGYQLAGQILYHPMLDDTFAYPSSSLYYGDVWHAVDDQRAFDCLMGSLSNRSATPDDAVPGRCRDFRGLPPTVIHSGDLDFGHDAAMAYAQGIMNAGIYCDLRIWGGCFHTGAAMAYGTPLCERWEFEMEAALTDLLSGRMVRE